MKFILLCMYLLGFIAIGCEEKIYPVDSISSTEGISYFSIFLNGIEYDTFKVDCNESFTTSYIGWIETEQSFILRQGPENVKINDSIFLTVLIIIFDSTTLFEVYTPEVFAQYINEKPQDVSIDIELRLNNNIYRNQWYTDWDINDYLQRTIVDGNTEFSLYTGVPIEPECTESWPLLPVTLNYTGSLTTEDRQDTLLITSFGAKINLYEAF